MNRYESLWLQVAHFAAGLVVGLVVVVLITLAGFPRIFILWGVAAAVITWMYFQPEDPDDLLGTDQAEGGTQ